MPAHATQPSTEGQEYYQTYKELEFSHKTSDPAYAQHWGEYTDLILFPDHLPDIYTPQSQSFRTTMPHRAHCVDEKFDSLVGRNTLRKIVGICSWFSVFALFLFFVYRIFSQYDARGLDGLNGVHLFLVAFTFLGLILPEIFFKSSTAMYQRAFTSQQNSKTLSEL